MKKFTKRSIAALLAGIMVEYFETGNKIRLCTGEPNNR